MHVRAAHQQQQTNNCKCRDTSSNDGPAAKKTKRTDQTTVSTASEPSATPHSAPQASAATASSSWEADPVLIPSNLLFISDAQTYQQHWPQIRTRFSRHNRLQDWYSFHLSTIDPASLREQPSRMFADQPTVFKINFSSGFILRNTESGAL